MGTRELWEVSDTSITLIGWWNLVFAYVQIDQTVQLNTWRSLRINCASKAA